MRDGREARADGETFGDAVNGERAHDGIPAPGISRAVVVAIVMILSGIVPEVLVVPARVPMGNQAIHQGGEASAHRETEGHLGNPRGIEASRRSHARHGFAEQPERRRRQHQARAEAEDAVVDSPRQLANEQKGQSPDPGGESGHGRGDHGGAHEASVLHYTCSVPSEGSAIERVVYLALGANLGDRGAAIVAATGSLAVHGPLSDVRLSPIYETDAVADHPQPPYLNAVLRARTARSPHELLAACLAVEEALGRTRPAGIARAARTMDVDVLLVGDTVIDTRSLTVPHPELLRRPFVRIPLADVAEVGLVHPVTGEALDVAEPHPGVRRWSVTG